MQHKELYNTKNEKVTDNFNRKTPNTIEVQGFCALKAKTYCFKPNDEKEIEKKE